ncbi:unnamed protein product, partial [Prorocentrum cordatum]
VSAQLSQPSPSPPLRVALLGGGGDLGNAGAPASATLAGWTSRAEASRAGAELKELVEKELPGAAGRAGAWRALRCRRDARALLEAQPPRGLTGVPAELEAFREFDAAVRSACRRVEARMARAAQGIPINSICGAWEGGLPAVELSSPSVEARAVALVLSAFNVQGGLGTFRGEGAHEGRARALVAELHRSGTVIAVVSEPRLAPGGLWPSWAGYAYHGERGALPDTVALIVLNEAARAVGVLEDVGDARSIWAAVPLQGDGRGGLLLLGVYGPPPGHGAGVRRAFRLARLQEWRLLQHRPRFRGWALVLAGDFNPHFSALGGISACLEERLDREVWGWLQDGNAFGVVVRNPVGVATRSSGSVIDVVAASAGLAAVAAVVPAVEAGVTSDHCRLDLSVGVTVGCVGTQTLLLARWARDADWGEALLLLAVSLRFLTGWAGAAMPPRGVGAPSVSATVECEEWPGELQAVAALAAADANAPAAKAAAKHLDRYLELAAVAPGDAEAFLSQTLNPRAPVQLAFRDPLSGALLGVADALGIVAADVLTRGLEAGDGDATFNREVELEVGRIRREANFESAAFGDSGPFHPEDIDAVLRQLQ